MQIIFRGLIAHVEITNASRCVLVKDIDKIHRPVLIAAEGDFTNNGFPVLKSTGGFTWFDLRNLIVNMTGLKPGSPIWKTHFRYDVPSLQAVLKFNSTTIALDDLIYDDETLHDSAFSYVDITGGSLNMLDCFDSQAKFAEPDPHDPKCLARHVIYTADNTDTVQLKDQKGHSLTIQKDATIQIFNRAGGGNHFHEFLNIAATYASGIRCPKPVANSGDDSAVCVGCLPVHAPKPEPTPVSGTSARDRHNCGANSMGSAKPADGRGADVECTNSHWP